MNTAQKLIKAFALALAMIIVISIFGALVGGVYVVGNLISGTDDAQLGEITEIWTEDEDEEVREIRSLNINVKATSVRLRRVQDGDRVRVETNNDYIVNWIDGSTLEIVEKSHGFFGLGGQGDLVIYTRESVRFDDVNIEIGAGTLEIEDLETKRLDLDLGAGKAQIRNLKVTEEADIEGGTGKTAIVDSELRDARINLGVGKADVEARLLGDSRLVTGVGKLDLVLLGKETDYKLTIDKGIGAVELNGSKLGDGARWGEGKNRVDLEAGIGAVDIRIRED